MYDYILNELPTRLKQIPTNGNVPLWDIQWRTRCIGIGTETKNVIKAFLPFRLFYHHVSCLGERKSLYYCLFRNDREKWQQYDAVPLIQQGYKVQGMRIDQA